MKLSDVTYDIYSIFPSAHFDEVQGEVVIYTGMFEDAMGNLHPTKERVVD